MKHLIYFSYGMTKCGTTLTFHMASGALSQAGYEQHRLPAHLIGPNKKLNFGQHYTHSEAADLWEAVQSIDNPIVIKTHTRSDPTVLEMIQNGQAINHACYRDPRDMALSMLDHGNRARANGNPTYAEIETINNAKTGILNQCDSLTTWLRMPNVMPLDFEVIAFDMMATAQRILNQLEINGDVERIVDKVLDGRFTQFIKGVSTRHKTEIAENEVQSFETEFALLLMRLIDDKHTIPTDGSIVLPPPHELRTTV